MKEVAVTILTEVGQCEVVYTIQASKLTLVDVGHLGREVTVVVAYSRVLEQGVAITDTEMTGAACVDKLRTPLVPTG